MAKVGLTSATLWVFSSNTEWEEMVLNIIQISNFFSPVPKKEHIYKCKAVTLPWKQLYGLYNQNKNPSILTYSYKQQTFEYISRLNDHVRDSRIWNSEGLPSNTWCNAKQIYRAGLHQQKLSTVVLPNNQPLQNGMNNRKILNNQEKNKQINKKNWNTLKETYSFK